MDSPNDVKATPLTVADIATIQPEPPKYSLTVPVVAVLLAKGKTHEQIGALHNVSHQAVTQFIQRNFQELEAIKDYDSIMAAKMKQQTLRVIDSVATHNLKKEGLIAKNAFIGTGIEKVRLIEGKSTQNISSITRLCQELEDKRRPQDVDNRSNQRTDGGDEGDNT